MSKLQKVESEVRAVWQRERRQIRDCLYDFIEEKLKFTPEFERSILRSESHLAHGKPARVQEPQGS